MGLEKMIWGQLSGGGQCQLPVRIKDFVVPNHKKDAGVLRGAKVIPMRHTKEMWSQSQTFGIKRERKREEIKNREEEHCTRG